MIPLALYNYSMGPEQRLRLFVRLVKELGGLKMVREQMGYNVALNFDQIEGLSIRLDTPDEEALRSFLLTFRKFVSPSEHVHVNRIYNICFQSLESNNKLKEYLMESRKVWIQALRTSFMELKFNESKVSPEELADLWMNGYYFHDDLDKYERLEKMLTGPSAPFVQAHFLQFLISATRVVAYLGNFVDQALKNEHFRF